MAKLHQWAKKTFGQLTPEAGALKRARERALSAAVFEDELAALSEDDFDARLASFRQEWARLFAVHGHGNPKGWGQAKWPQKELQAAELLALAREVGRRQLGVRLYDSQLTGASLLMEGHLAEMATGEGKTFVAPVAALYDALAGIPTHVVTVNTYLAGRDAHQLAPFYGRFGLSTGLLGESDPLHVKQEAYGCDVVYGVNHEFGFDYLRDQLATTASERAQRQLGSAIVDEVDSILIDEARTPLIMSGPHHEDLAVHLAARDIIESLPAEWVDVDEKDKMARAKEVAFDAIEKGFVHLGWIAEGHHLYEGDSMGLLRAAQAALNARFVYKKDQHYIVDGEIKIIDEFTGRIMEGRNWSEGLHQAIEAKERVALHQDNKTLATITYQNYFRLYGKLSGMTGTAMTQAPEFWSVYGLRVVRAPTNRPVQRKDWPDAVFRTREEKLMALIEQARAASAKNQPVLVGTSNIEDAEEISRRLTEIGHPHELLSAKNHAREAAIISEAGRPGAITVATNMAGRGADISLGGSLSNRLNALDPNDPEFEQKIEQERAAHLQRKAVALEAGGLLVLGSSRHESRRIDNQLRGRSGRQGDPGASRFLLSLEDELFRVYANSPIMGLLARPGVLPFGVPIEHGALTRALEKGQTRVEALHATSRQQALDYDNIMSEQRNAVYAWRAAWTNLLEDPWEILFDFGQEAIEQVAQQALDEVGGMVDDVTLDRLEDLAEVKLGGAPTPDWPLEQSKKWPEKEWPQRLALAAREEWVDAFAAVRAHPESKSWILPPLLWGLDQAWQDHLTALSGLRELIHLRAYAQGDPKREYARDALSLFKNMRERVGMDSLALAFPVACATLNWALSQPQPDEGQPALSADTPIEVTVLATEGSSVQTEEQALEELADGEMIMEPPAQATKPLAFWAPPVLAMADLLPADSSPLGPLRRHELALPDQPLATSAQTLEEAQEQEQMEAEDQGEFDPESISIEGEDQGEATQAMDQESARDKPAEGATGVAHKSDVNDPSQTRDLPIA